MKRIAAILLAAVLLGGLVGCSKSPPKQQGETVSFTDSCGREVEIPKTITAIAPSGSLSTMILATIAPEYLVGVSSTPSSAQAKYLPENLLRLPTFGQMYGGKSTLNLESLLSASPQLIIDMGDKRDDTGSNLDALQKRTGIPAIFIEADLPHMAEAYRTLGKLLSDKADRGEALAAFADRSLEMAEKNAASISDEQRRTVMYTTGTTGLNTNAAGSVQAQVIDIIGAENAIYTDTISNRMGGTTINMEQLFNFDPDVIVMSPGGPFATMATDSLWSQLRAVQNGDYYEIPAAPYNWMAEPPSINMLLGIWWLGNLVYPEVYNYDVAEVAKEFYQLFWDYTLTDDEVTALLANSTGKAAARESGEAAA